MTNLNDMSYVSESAEVVDVEDGVPIIEVNTKSGKQRLKPSDIDKDRSQEVNY